MKDTEIRQLAAEVRGQCLRETQSAPPGIGDASMNVAIGIAIAGALIAEAMASQNKPKSKE